MVSGSLETLASNDEFSDFATLGRRVTERLEKDLPATPTGYPRLDQALGGGLFSGRLYGLCAPKKAGKTNFLGSIAYQLCEQEIGWCYAALEMGPDQIFERLLARRMQYNSSDFLHPKIRKNQQFRDKVDEAISWFEGKNAVFRSRPGMHLDDLLALLARVAMSKTYQGVFIDYLQLIGGRPKTVNETYWLDDVAQSLAEAAKRYNLWIIVAAQIGRNDQVYGGDGLGRACDMNLELCRVEQAPGDPSGMPHRAWIKMIDSRFTPIRDIGSEAVPAYNLDTSAGPHFRELARPS